MKYAADFRKIARDSLSGRWGIAVITGLVASLLGGSTYASGNVNFNFNTNNINTESGTEHIPPFEGMEEMLILFLSVFGVVMLISLVISVVYLFLGSVTSVGYARFNLDLVDRQKDPDLGTLFQYFKQWKTTFAALLLQKLYIFLWSLLCVIPGIIATYSYAMTRFIIAEHPELTASQAISRSKEMMEGNRFRLFCLRLSFIGWSCLVLLTCGAGALVLNPYMEAAEAAFYREISGTEFIFAPVDASLPEPEE